MWNGDCCLTAARKPVLKFSQDYLKQIELLKQKDYQLTSVKINLVLYWLKEGASQEIKIILPELCFQKQSGRINQHPAIST
jgi:ATP-dependent DNA helicase RecQ